MIAVIQKGKTEAFQDMDDGMQPEQGSWPSMSQCAALTIERGVIHHLGCFRSIAINQLLQGRHLAGFRLQLVKAWSNKILVQVGGACAGQGNLLSHLMPIPGMCASIPLETHDGTHSSVSVGKQISQELAQDGAIEAVSCESAPLD